jgi:hypothetical protein
MIGRGAILILRQAQDEEQGAVSRRHCEARSAAAIQNGCHHAVAGISDCFAALARRSSYRAIFSSLAALPPITSAASASLMPLTELMWPTGSGCAMSNG